MSKAEKQQIKSPSMMDILAKLRKTFGNDAIFSGDDPILDVAEPISTGSYALDSTIGLGGVPRGRITQLAGAEGSGKTLMALQIVKQWQSQHPANYALWIDAEHSFNKAWATLLGVDVDRMMIHQENLGTEVFTFLCGVPGKKDPQKKDKLGALDEFILEGENCRCGVVVIDSIAAIEPPAEAAYEVGKQNMATMARFMAQALRRLTPLVSQANVALIGINQLRADPSVMYGDPVSSPGGRAWKHFCRLMINFSKVNAKDELILNDEEEPIGHTIRAKIQKNSFAIPRETKFVVKYLEGVAFHNVEMLDLAIKYNIVERPNNVSYIYGEQKWRGRGDAEEALLDKKTFDDIWEKVKLARKDSLRVEAKTATKEILGTDDTDEDLEKGE